MIATFAIAYLALSVPMTLVCVAACFASGKAES